MPPRCIVSRSYGNRETLHICRLEHVGTEASYMLGYGEQHART